MPELKSRIRQFREHAAECNAQKRRALNDQAKASWENLERQWQNLADEAERTEKRNNPAEKE